MRGRLATTLALAALATAPSAATADDGGTGGTAFTPPPVAPLTPGGLLRGSVRWSGTFPGGAGPVRVERFDPASGSWNPVAHTTAADDGSFVAAWAGDALGTYTVRAVADGNGASTSDAPPTAVVTVFRPARATWYGPGFYGHRLACGGRLTQSTLGVAHRTLPCGTPVQVYYRGRALTVPVVDRGPFANGASYDLTAATAQALGMRQTSRIGVLPQPPAAGARKPKSKRRG
jgi:rare lipoprotein A